MRFAPLLACLLIVPALSGCLVPTASKPVPLSGALMTLEEDIRDADPIILSDLGTDREPMIATSLEVAQCHKPNLVPVVTGPVNLQLQGMVQWQANKTLSANPSIAFVVTRSNQQQVTVPLTFVSLGGLPDFYMNQRLANLTNLSVPANDQSKLAESINASKAELVADILAKRQKLKVLIDKATANFDPNKCPAKGQPFPIITTMKQDEEDGRT